MKSNFILVMCIPNNMERGFLIRFLVDQQAQCIPYDVGLILDQRRRRWDNVKQILGKLHLGFCGEGVSA